MLKRLRERAGSESGFTLIELLVVMLILGILAAIAIPAFLNQKNKATDASAKSMARTMQTAAETYNVDNNGSYVSMTIGSLQSIEGAIQSSASGPVTAVAVSGTGGTGNPAASSYRVTATSSTGNTFWVDKNGSTVSRGCSVPSGQDRGGCPASGNW